MSETRNRYIDVLFDGPPGHVAGRFVEVENEDGASIRAGEWVNRGDGYWALRIEVASEPSPQSALEAENKALLDGIEEYTQLRDGTDAEIERAFIVGQARGFARRLDASPAPQSVPEGLRERVAEAVYEAWRAGRFDSKEHIGDPDPDEPEWADLEATAAEDYREQAATLLASPQSGDGSEGEPVRFMDQIDADAAAGAFIEGVRRRCSAFLPPPEIQTLGFERADGRVMVLWDGVKLLACAVIVRDDSNFSWLVRSTPLPDSGDSERLDWWEPWRDRLAEDRTGHAGTLGAACLLRDEGYPMQADLLLACLDHSYAAMRPHESTEDDDEG